MNNKIQTINNKIRLIAQICEEIINLSQDEKDLEMEILNRSDTMFRDIQHKIEIDGEKEARIAIASLSLTLKKLIESSVHSEHSDDAIWKVEKYLKEGIRK